MPWLAGGGSRKQPTTRFVSSASPAEAKVGTAALESPHPVWPLSSPRTGKRCVSPKPEWARCRLRQTQPSRHNLLIRRPFPCLVVSWPPFYLPCLPTSRPLTPSQRPLSTDAEAPSNRSPLYSHMAWTYNTADDVPSGGPYIAITALAFTAVSLLAVGLRFYVRVILVKSFGPDDWVLLVTWVSRALPRPPDHQATATNTPTVCIARFCRDQHHPYVASQARNRTTPLKRATTYAPFLNIETKWGLGLVDPTTIPAENLYNFGLVCIPFPALLLGTPRLRDACRIGG